VSSKADDMANVVSHTIGAETKR